MKKVTYVVLFFFTTSCSNLEFVYNDSLNLINPLYERTSVVVSGVDLVFMNSYIPMFFGKNKNNDFNLLINIKEKKIKRSVETNQATSDLRYELRFFYKLFSNIENCNIYEKEILSYFSIIPKSAGYNYGTDASLEKKYELAVNDNLNQFISFLSGVNINNCK
tara:strand:- start:1771 stop:2259 length:489 start_codon:yes stop_codon:yes gene_type:complete